MDYSTLSKSTIEDLELLKQQKIKSKKIDDIIVKILKLESLYDELKKDMDKYKEKINDLMVGTFAQFKNIHQSSELEVQQSSQNTESKPNQMSNDDKKGNDGYIERGLAFFNQFKKKEDIQYIITYFSNEQGNQYYTPIKNIIEKCKYKQNIVFKMEKGNYNEMITNPSFNEEKKFSIFTIFLSGARLDWGVFNEKIEALERNNYIVVLVIIRSGDGAQIINSTEFDGFQINLRCNPLKIFYEDDSNYNSIFNLFRTFLQYKDNN